MVPGLISAFYSHWIFPEVESLLSNNLQNKIWPSSIRASLGRVDGSTRMLSNTFSGSHMTEIIIFSVTNIMQIHTCNGGGPNLNSSFYRVLISAFPYRINPCVGISGFCNCARTATG